MENQPVFEKSMANLLEIHGIRGKSKRIHGIFTDGKCQQINIFAMPVAFTVK